MNGELQTGTFTFDGGRQVTAYVPPDPPDAVVYVADGGWHTAGLAQSLGTAGTSATMIVGVQGLDDDDGRLEEYIAAFGGERFDAYERFFVDDVRHALREAGAGVILMERNGEHGGAFWREEFPLMVSWAFGA